MREKNIETREESRPEWETLEAFARQGVQRLVQRVLEEEVEELWAATATRGGRPSMPRAAIATASTARGA